MPSARYDAASGASSARSSSPASSALPPPSILRRARLRRDRGALQRAHPASRAPSRETPPHRAAVAPRVASPSVSPSYPCRSASCASGRGAASASVRKVRERDREHDASDLREQERPAVHVARATTHPRRRVLGGLQLALAGAGWMTRGRGCLRILAPNIFAADRIARHAILPLLNRNRHPSCPVRGAACSGNRTCRPESSRTRSCTSRLAEAASAPRAHPSTVAGHVRAELRLDGRRHLRRIEADAVRATRNVRELDRVACLHREVGRIEAIALLIAEHLHIDRLARGRCGSNGAASRRSRRAAPPSQQPSCQQSPSLRPVLHRRGIRLGSILVAAGASAEDKYAREERPSDEPHSYSLQYVLCALRAPQPAEIRNLRPLPGRKLQTFGPAGTVDAFPASLYVAIMHMPLGITRTTTASRVGASRACQGDTCRPNRRLRPVRFRTGLFCVIHHQTSEEMRQSRGREC